MDSINVVGISGSLREESFNRRLLSAFAGVAPESISFTIHDLRGLPMYDGDVEAAGDPDSVVALKDAVRSADAVLFAAPEYNGGIPGTLKNAIDWASRGDGPLMGKPCAIIGGGGRLATARSQMMVRAILGHMGCPLLPAPTLYLAGIARSFDDGVLVDEKAMGKLRDLGPALAEWVNKLS